ncbi:MAG: hypothetical protein NC200_08280 [Candidatus Gastranaerophilales bacterium]|nr:hypothetical protein [Candidatus Gastranaerophilales bacterium]
MLELKIKRNNLLPIVLLSGYFLMLFFFFIKEISNLERVVLPSLITFFIGIIIFAIINYIAKDKFTSKIYLISILSHFIFILFWQILKYHLLGLPLPTEYTFYGYISDVDGITYHQLAVFISKYFSLDTLSIRMYGGLFPKIVGTIYHILTFNPFFVVCIHSILSGFIACLIYFMGKETLNNISYAKLYAVLSILCFAHLMNTSTLIRDVYIVLFMYASIYSSYLFYQRKNFLYLLFTALSLFLLYLFRPYAAYIMFFAIISTYILKNVSLKIKDKKFKMNKVSFILTIFSPIICFVFLYVLIQISTTMNITSTEDLIATREIAYSGSNTDYMFDFATLYHKFFLLPYIIGYICIFFAPFPWEWVLARRIIYVADMVVLYLFLPSFFKNIKKVFTDKKYFLVVSFLSMLFMFSIYCITLGNSGAIHRLRGPFIPMIYLIALSKPDIFLQNIIHRIQKLNLL